LLHEILSGLHQRVINEAIDYVAWTCVRTGWWNLKHLLWKYESYLSWCDNPTFMCRFHVKIRYRPTVNYTNSCYILQGTVRTYKTKCGKLSISVCCKYCAMFLPQISKIGRNLTKI